MIKEEVFIVITSVEQEKKTEYPCGLPGYSFFLSQDN